MQPDQFPTTGNGRFPPKIKFQESKTIAFEKPEKRRKWERMEER
jgi:hypothetical protein